MGVVRSSDGWKLRRQEAGLYHIVYRGETRAKIITEDYEVTDFATDVRFDVTLPVHEVESFTDAESVFEDYVNKSGGVDGFGLDSSTDGLLEGGTGQTGEDVDLEDIPPIGFILLGFIVSGYVVTNWGVDLRNPVFLVGIAFGVIGIAFVGLALREYHNEGLGAAVEFLLSTGESGDSGTNDSRSDQEKTPQPSESLKNELIFDRADQHCEWCNNFVDHPHVHHIEPRAEGGPNEPGNLIVLCPNCHEKADREAIPRSKLRAKVRRQMDSYPG